MLKTTLDTITRIINQGAYINIALNEALSQADWTSHERRLMTNIVYGVVENRIRIDYELAPLIKGKRLKPFLKNSLRMGVYMLEMQLATHYVVDAIVQMVKAEDFKGSKLVNGVLRTFLKQPKLDLSKLSKRDYLHLKYSFPQDLLDVLLDDYPEQIESILNVFQTKRANSYRINLLKCSIDDVKARLDDEQIEYELAGVLLVTKRSLIKHHLFISGLIVAMDPSSMKVAPIMDVKSGDYVLDLCSAPGSKTMHMACLMNNIGEIIACDIHPHKLKLVEENADKLGVKIIKTKLADARIYESERLFDAVLVDAPCSGLGVLAHKVDLKYNMTKEKIEELCIMQKEILDNASKLVKVNGYLTYSTCTMTKCENEEQIEKFIKRHPNFIKVYEEAILPSKDGDGFYICKLLKGKENV